MRSFISALAAVFVPDEVVRIGSPFNSACRRKPVQYPEGPGGWLCLSVCSSALKAPERGLLQSRPSISGYYGPFITGAVLRSHLHQRRRFQIPPVLPRCLFIAPPLQPPRCLFICLPQSPAPRLRPSTRAHGHPPPARRAHNTKCTNQKPSARFFLMPLWFTLPWRASERGDKAGGER